MATVTASYNWVSGETVTPTKLNSTAAPTVVVADNEVTTAKILDANVTTAKIADANVTAAKLASNAVETAKINSGAVTGPKLADGMVVQVARAETSTITLVSSANSAHYFDYSAALSNAQGIEILTQAITPTSATNKVLVRVVCPYSGSGSLTPIVAVFRGSATAPIATAWESISSALVGNLVLEFSDLPATTSATTYRVRIGRGGSAGWYNNAGIDGATIMGGTLKTTLTLTEIKAS
jgi:hypothetical protein